MDYSGTKEKKDTAQKDFMAFPDITADTINVLLYQGRKLVDAGDLWAGPTESFYQGRENGGEGNGLLEPGSPRSPYSS